MRRYQGIAVALLAALAAAGCGETKQPAGAPPGSTGADGAAAATSAASASGEAAPSGNAPTDATFTYANGNNIVTDFDPATSYSNEVIALNNVYEQLTRYDAETKTVKPLLADSWTSTADGKSWTFRLHPGVTFHTGKPVTAAAAKAAIERTIKLKGGAAYIWDAVETIQAPDDATLTFKLKYAAPIDLISSSTYAAFIYDTTAAGDGDLKKWFGQAKDAGTGPYVVGAWKKGDQNELRLEQFPDYWRGWEGAHYKHVLFQYVPEETTRRQLLDSGQASMADRLSPQLFAEAKDQGRLATAERPSFQNLIAFLNTSHGPLKDVRVRQAVSKAIDYEGIVAVLKGSAVPASGLIPEGLLGYKEGLAQAKDLDAAKTLMGQAGYGEGKRAKLLLTISNGDADQRVVATLLKSNLAEIGIDVTVQPLEWQTQWDKAKSTDPTKRQDIFVMYWWPDYADPFSWFVNLFKSADPPFFNVSYLVDPAIDKQIDALPSLTATDREAAQASYEAIQTRLLEQAVAVPLYVVNYQRVLQKNVSGYVDNPAYANVAFVYDLTPTG
ncbi:MAG: Oligopeptide ABC transporter, periplasmic oligopeptide-binding protein OppA [uncultured Thermoleophilia bacterium]|uniref:Oligopeptide ABC transporter, periplasmic oligopeptide-binding protein OppA n=1 Tax=uncultured Thermoleophilia bacterium TaxID=1497501 RepID=A0A6J4U8L5_9ACTN|nr:MAG: Oligopeptide ABC transporter, periplasmic oligopeptide-binding protein OppA [uncultured Thermoleophilia bacterium]